ncbi:hypothetical protein SOPP22_12010 [Shewanella sp. OPT22]|nr:hypothetical protein SOPP22_12010 [Shewanella sp. OPT22]
MNKIFILLLLFGSSQALAIDACNEHGYCEKQGLPFVIVTPKFTESQLEICSNKSFKLKFDLLMGKPENVKIIKGIKTLNTSVVKAFKQWQFSGVQNFEGVFEFIELDSVCKLKEHRGLIQVLKSQKNRSRQ